MLKKSFSVSVAGVLLLFFAAWAAPASAGRYSVTKKISISGQVIWEYLTVDEANRRLYVSHGTRVEVLDLDSKTLSRSRPSMGRA